MTITGWTRKAQPHLALRSELGPLVLSSLDNRVLVVDLKHAGILANGLRPLVKVGGLFLEAGGEIGRDEAVLGEGQCSNDERGSEDLSCHLLIDACALEEYLRRFRVLTSAKVSLSLPPKNGAAVLRSGSTSLTIPAIASSTAASLSSSVIGR